MLWTRQKFLIDFLKSTKNCSKLKMVKIFFIIEKEGKISQSFKFYKFIPYKYGPYSFELFHDIEILEKDNYISVDKKNIKYLQSGTNISSEFSSILNDYIKKYHKKTETELIEYIYKKYPEYTIFSEISQKKDYKRNRKGVFSLGYEGLSIDEFLMKLIEEKVQILVDVRNNPWSMKFGFKKHVLKSFSNRLGIEYLHKPVLGIPGKYRKELKTKEDYDKLFDEYRKQLPSLNEEIKTLHYMAKESRIALMCFEKDPNYCHRTIIAEELCKLGCRGE
jgi:uncharacterized protein (DUF488 family)